MEGGLWNDENLEQSLEWQGDKGATRDPDEKQQTTRQTKKAERTEILKESGLNVEAIRALSETVEERILHGSGFSSKTFKGAVATMLSDHDKRLKEWLLSTQTEQQTTIDTNQASAIAGLSERISVLERKLDEILVATVNRDGTELDIVRQASQIVIDKHREDAATGETPSEVHRMEFRTEELEARMHRLQQLAHTAHAPSSPIQTASDKRKKLKKLF